MKMKLIENWGPKNKAGKEVEINAIRCDFTFSGHYAVRAKLGKWQWVSIHWFVKGDKILDFVRLP